MLNTFASEHLYFEEKINEPFCLVNASNLTHKFCITIYQNFHTKTPVPILMHFLDKMAYLFFFKMEALRREIVKAVLKFRSTIMPITCMKL